MKLNAQQVAKVHDQTGVKPVPENHPVAEDLKDTFGDHTFYLASEGLYVLESMEPPQDGGQMAKAMVVASWTDESRTELMPHEPQSTTLIVTLDDSGPDPAA